MSMPTLLITRFQLAKGDGHIMLSLTSPSGDIRNGKVEEVEVARVAFTPELFQQLATMCAQLAAPRPTAPTGDAPSSFTQDEGKKDAAPLHQRHTGPRH